MTRKKKTILILNQYYLPGYKAGGPIRSISNFVSWLGDEFHFKVITTDRDSFEKQPYDGINVNDWNRVGKADVYYLKMEDLNFGHIYKLLKETGYDAVYLNSFFNLWFSLIPIIILKLFLSIDPSKILLIPRGELSEGALESKKIKKKSFIQFSRLIHLHQNIKWQATNKDEKKEILRYFGVSNNHIYIGSNLPKKITIEEIGVSDKKETHLNIVYLSRVTPKKNLDYALNLLSNVKKGTIKFDIYGIIDDQDYWNKCLKIINELPGNIVVNYLDVIRHENVIPTLKNYHLFLLPTKGENFGHAIYEAMISGTPVLISNKTPWKDLEQKGLGWEINLKFSHKFLEIIELLQNENTSEIYARKKRVKEQILKFNVQKTLKTSRKMLEDILG